MSNSTRRRGAAGAQQRGLFENGVWQCDCNPRQPAVHFEVKKQGPNQGRWFRTCQKQQDDRNRCKFFLWDSDAHPREAAALANNTRTEPSHATPRASSKRPVSPPPPHTNGIASGEPSRKRARTTTIDSDEEYGFIAHDATFERELDHTTAPVTTPRRAASASDMPTPSTTRTLPWNKDITPMSSASGMQTPHSSQTVQPDPFTSRLGRSLLTTKRAANATQLIATPSPSPYETRTSHRPLDLGADDLLHEVFSLFQNANVTLDTIIQTELDTLLSKHTKAAEGLRRGRDVTRSMIKARDANIAELGYRVSTLEAELEAEKAMVKHLQWQMQNEYVLSP